MEEVVPVKAAPVAAEAAPKAAAPVIAEPCPVPVQEPAPVVAKEQPKPEKKKIVSLIFYVS